MVSSRPSLVLLDPISDECISLHALQGEKEAAKGFRIGVDLSKKRKLEIGPGAGYSEVRRYGQSNDGSGAGY
jgi:hypothetical protein